MNAPQAHLYGLVGQFASADKLIQAAEKVRDAGYKKIDAYAPYPVEGLSQALGLSRWDNLVPQLTLLGGLGGGLTGFFFQYWVNVYSYPLNIGGRPLNSWPAFIPVTFELTILGASTFAVFGMLALNKLPQPHHPVFSFSRFSGASTDCFFISIEATDPKFDLAETARFLQSVQAQHVTEVYDE